MHGAIERISRGITTSAVLIAIVVASTIGLNAWADEMAVQTGHSATGA